MDKLVDNAMSALLYIPNSYPRSFFKMHSQKNCVCLCAGKSGDKAE